MKNCGSADSEDSGGVGEADVVGVCWCWCTDPCCGDVGAERGVTPHCVQANQREESYKEQIKTLTTKLKQVTGGQGPRPPPR